MYKFLLIMTLLISANAVRAGAYEDIIIATEGNDTAKVIEFLNRGMDVNTADRQGTTLLMMAARNGNTEVVKSLLASRANVNRRNQYGDTALSLAALNGKLDTAKLLIDHKADLNPSGWTPLHYAVFSGNGEMTSMLIARGAQLDVRAPNGQTALMLAVKAERLDLVKQLVAAKADRNLTDPDGHTAWQLAEQLKFKEIADYLQKFLNVR